MGTSKLYRGPKKTILLPSDYLETEGEEEISSQDEPNVDEEVVEDNIDDLTVNKWRNVKSQVTKATNTSRPNTKNVIIAYVVALGGHNNATRQANVAIHTTTRIISLLSGSINEISDHLKEVGILIGGRPTKDIFHDICLLLSPGHNNFEEELVGQALTQTITEIMKDDDFDNSHLDIFNKDMLARMVGGLIKYYIYYKLIHDISSGMLYNNKTSKEIDNVETNILYFIDGIVCGVMEKNFHKEANKKGIITMVKNLYEESYKIMEDM